MQSSPMPTLLMVKNSNFFLEKLRDDVTFVQCLFKELQMIFQTSDVSIYNGNMKDPIGSLTFYTKIYVEALPCFVAVAII